MVRDRSFPTRLRVDPRPGARNHPDHQADGQKRKQAEPNEQDGETREFNERHRDIRAPIRTVKQGKIHAGLDAHRRLILPALFRCQLGNLTDIGKHVR